MRQEIDLPPETEELIKEMQTFAYGSYVGIFSVATNSVTYKEQNDPNFEGAITAVLGNFESLGVRNITTKQEEFTTKSGVQGLKTYGAGSLKTPGNNKSKRAKYNILSFGGKGFMQQVIITWEDGDDYAEQIVTRILKYVGCKNPSLSNV